MKAVFSVVVLFALAVIILSVAAQVQQKTRDSFTNQTAPGYVVSDATLNATQQSVFLSKTTGTIVGVIILVGFGLVGLIAVLMFAVKAVQGGKEGGGRGRRRFGE